MEILLAYVKKALRKTTDAFDDEIALYIQAGLRDLEIAGIVNLDKEDPLIRAAIIAFCKWRFGENEVSEKYKALYETQKAQLKMATGYTDWGK